MLSIRKYQSRLPLYLYAVSDFVLPLVLIWVLYVLLLNQPWTEIYLWLGVLAGFAMVFGVFLLNGYSRTNERTIAQKLRQVFSVWILVVLGLIFLAFLQVVSDQFARKIVVSWAVITPFILIGARILINQFCYKLEKQATYVLLLEPYSFTDFEKARLAQQHVEVEVLTSIEDLSNQLAMYQPHFVVLNLSVSQSPSLVKTLTHLELSGTHLIKLEQFMETFLRKCYVDYNVADLAYLQEVRPYSRLAYFIKRMVDVSVALSLLLLTWPVMLYAMRRIKKESPGSVIFSQERIGRNAKPFKIYKFRSMHENAHFDPYTQQEDVRIFPFGSIMRKTRIDELPQLWNVLKGDMHLFGPRSEWSILVDDYEKDIPFYHERHLVAPGISGWAQVMYPYGSCVEDARQKLMYDLYYIKNWSIWLEIETMIRTVGVVLGKKGI